MGNVTPLPQLFDKSGALIEVNMTTMDAPTLARLEAVRAAVRASQEAEQRVVDAVAEVEASARAVKNTKEYHDAHFPPQTAMALIKETLAQNQINRAEKIKRGERVMH
jgi:hypothetical protein